ncbi:hypothetical protein PAN31117_04103 [Pandoraea anapnoica]|uniref:Uncharacterized protein n=1 Tax=Pandoraea anapnoica TaxID=2508301 RepID=A0A5E5AGG9_9BURK|nr:hypothetical protein [Pandoraea anapnoica]VVE71583.1 hypothetical protein PAN31117_04103 [Pandoraea anapnoica]
MASIVHVQFEDGTEQKIVRVFGNPQEIESYPNQGAIPSDDPRYSLYFEESLPKSVQAWFIRPGY